MAFSPKQLRRGMWMWPPFLGSGVRVAEVSDDETRMVIEHRLRPWNRNAVGTVFGGTLQSMTDPFFMLLTMHHIGRDHVVWDTEAQIRFVKPGKGRVRVTIEVPPETIALMQEKTADGSKYLHWFDCDVVDEEGDVVAHVRRQVYVRRKRGR